MTVTFLVQPILMILVSKFIVHRVLSDKTYLSLGLLSPLTIVQMVLVLCISRSDRLKIDFQDENFKDLLF